jgi:hypothetical protein
MQLAGGSLSKERWIAHTAESPQLMRGPLGGHKPTGDIVAQWSRGFAGNTHATRVQEAEAALRNAVAAFKAQGASAPPEALKTTRKLAEKLLSARLKMLKARLVALEDAGASGTMPGYAKDLASLRERLASTREQGLAGILTEFSVEQAVDSRYD